ncbi:MAG: hypothetical protein ACRC6U_07965, partial [Fusobacteriaceae bacterium]
QSDTSVQMYTSVQSGTATSVQSGTATSVQSGTQKESLRIIKILNKDIKGNPLGIPFEWIEEKVWNKFDESEKQFFKDTTENELTKKETYKWLLSQQEITNL